MYLWCVASGTRSRNPESLSFTPELSPDLGALASVSAPVRQGNRPHRPPGSSPAECRLTHLAGELS
jgi:hypothetical protein